MKQLIMVVSLILQSVVFLPQDSDTLNVDWTDTTKHQTLDEFLETYFDGVDFSMTHTNVFYGGVVPYSTSNSITL